MTWRYQPVFVTTTVGAESIQTFTICEVYIDKDKRLEAWTENRSVQPSGGSLSDLQSDLAYMLADSFRWEPVEFSELLVGMTFKRSDE